MNNEEIRDYIKKETETVPVPDSLAPENIKEQLSSRRQISGTKRRRLRAAAAAAACLLVLCIAGAALPFILRENTSDTDSSLSSTIDPELDKAPGLSYEEICRQINKYNEELSSEKDMYALEERTMDISEEAENTTGGSMPATDETAKSAAADKTSFSADKNSPDYSETDTQVKDVMEGDIVKTDGNYIYSVQEGVYGFNITIHKVEGERVKYITKLSGNDQNCSEMYLEGGKLFAIGNCWNTPDRETPAWKDEMLPESEALGETKTGITVFDITNPEKPGESVTLTQSGSYSTSRISDGYLYTFSNYCLNGSEYSPDIPDGFIPKAGDVLIPEKDLHSLGSAPSNRYMVMTSLAISKSDGEKFADQVKFQSTSAAFGDSSVYYMSNYNIYIATPASGSYNDLRTDIIKYRYHDGNFHKTAARQIRGQIANSYYFHEYKDNLAFVYTRRKSSGTVNGLCVLDQNLKPLGEITDLGINERIYSSYYIDNMAYFVTYRETDPVFAVDISTPEKPKLESELKLPGFSSYLHSFGSDLLLGIGEGETKDNYGGIDDCAKLSMFSIRNPKKLKEVMKYNLNAGTFTIADTNHKAVFVDEKRQLIGLGVASYYRDPNAKYILYRYKNGHLKKLHEKAIRSIESTRGIRIGSYFYIVDTESDKISCFPL